MPTRFSPPMCTCKVLNKYSNSKFFSLKANIFNYNLTQLRYKYSIRIRTSLLVLCHILLNTYIQTLSLHCGNPDSAKKSKVNMFTKECVCLMFQDQTWIPQRQERIELAKLG